MTSEFDKATGQPYPVFVTQYFYQIEATKWVLRLAVHQNQVIAVSKPSFQNLVGMDYPLVESNLKNKGLTLIEKS